MGPCFAGVFIVSLDSEPAKYSFSKEWRSERRGSIGRRSSSHP